MLKICIFNVNKVKKFLPNKSVRMIANNNNNLELKCDLYGKCIHSSTSILSAHGK